MSVSIKIVAVRGTTSYEFETVQQSAPGGTQHVVAYSMAQDDATNFERWLSQQPERQAKYDADFLSNRGAS